MRILGTKQTSAPPATLHATSADFCRIFEDDMDRLYRLSLLLTANPELAEKCFVRGLEDSKGGNPVFKEWAQSWARRTIISSAIRMIEPRPNNVSDRVTRHLDRLPRELVAVLGLQAFDRFVFVMSVLEGYSDRDCKLLLDCSTSDIVRARAHALRHLGPLTETAGKQKRTIDAPSKADNRGATLATVMCPPFPASA